MTGYTHPHHDPAHVMRCYRRYILTSKRKFGSARALIHYKAIVGEYLAAKREVIARGG